MSGILMTFFVTGQVITISAISAGISSAAAGVNTFGG
jgi:hypothetical protein